MGSASDKMKGATNDAVGRVKQAAGDLTGNNRLKAEGAGQQAKGKAQKAVGKAKSGLKKALDL